MPSTKPQVRELRPDDLERFADLCEQRDEFDRSAAERRAELVAHLAFRNPASDERPTYFVIEQGGRLMGHLGRMPTAFHIDGGRVRASYIHDLFVHPELRAGGRAFFLSMRLYRMCEQASPSFCALIWTNRINIELQTVRKYRQMWTARYVKLVRPDGQIERRLPRGAGGAGGGGGAGAAVRASLERVGELALRAADGAVAVLSGTRTVNVEPIGEFDARFDRLLDRTAPVLGISPVKDRAYLRWKYADRPRFSYAAFAAVGSGGELDGFAVVHVPDSEHHESYLLELVADPEDGATLAALLHEAVEHARRAGAWTIQAVATDPRVQALLRKFLFVARETPEPLFLANPERFENPAALAQIERWHLSFGDSEGPV